MAFCILKKNKRVVMKYQAPALSRGLEILELLSSKKEPLSLNQIALELNVNTSQIFRLLYVLVESEYINKDSSDAFAISGKLFSLGIQFITNYSFLDIVFPILKEISAKTNQSCHCSIKVGDKMVVIAKSDSPSFFGFSLRVGYSKFLEDSTSGKSILAKMEKDEFNEFIKEISKKHDKAFIAKLKTEIKAIKKESYTITDSSYVIGIKDIAVSVSPQASHLGTFCLVIPFVTSSDNICSINDALLTLQEGEKKILELMV